MIRNIFYGSILVAISVLTLALILEFLIFRFLLPASELPRLRVTSPNQVLKFQPAQKGVYRVKNEIAAQFKINMQGWNSVHTTYHSHDKLTKPLVAVIGDSYVEALQVDFDKSMAEQLEAQSNQSVTVYRFGVSGAPLSQYLYLYNNEVKLYHPDYVVFLLIHNDFKESIVDSQVGLYTNSFAKWEINADGMIGDMRPPAAYTAGLASIIRSTNFYRYLVVRMRVNVVNLKRRILTFLNEKPTKTNNNIANIDIFQLNNQLLTNITDKFFHSLASIQTSDSVKFIAIMDGPRGMDDKECHQEGNSDIRRINSLVSKIAKKHRIIFLDLSPSFFEAECKKGLSLRFATDGHWTEDAHRIAASVLKKQLF